MAAFCIIHDSKCKTKPDELKYFTPITFSKFLECRRIWLELQGDPNIVAEKSFEWISASDEDKFEKSGN